MKRRTGVIAAIVFVIALAVPVLWTSRSDLRAPVEAPPTSPAAPAPVESAAAPEKPGAESAEAARRLAMGQAYEELEAARKALRRRLGTLEAATWNVRLPPEDAARVSRGLTSGYHYLKNAPMLGAFRDVAEINAEIGRVRSLQGELDGVEQLIAAKGKQARPEP